EDDGEDAADEDVEEVVDARPAAPQPVQTLDVERQRHQHADERQDVDVLAERRIALRHRDQAGLEAQDVRQDEGGDAERRIGDDVERDEQAVVAPYHRAPSGAASVSSITSRMRARKRSRLNVSACARITTGSKGWSPTAS